MNKAALQEELCRQLCSDVRLVERDGKLMISNQFMYPDGDHYSIYLKDTGVGKVRISDGANTMMRLSYDTPDVDKYFKGNRGDLMQQILREHQVQEDDGDFYMEISIDKISDGLFRLGQALSQIYDLSYLNRDRAPSTFYEDLEALLNKIVSKYPVVLEKDHVVPDLQENAENYSIDYSLRKGERAPLFLFGIPTAEKAKLVTITLQHLLIEKIDMQALLIFKNQEDLRPGDLSRLVNANVGGSQVSSISATAPIEQNIERYVNAA